jgi:hypothetical protein
MGTGINGRFRTGDVCIESGWFEFDGYLDGATEPLPPLDEAEISLRAGDVFPAVLQPRRGCYWRQTGVSADPLVADVAAWTPPV